MTQTKLEEITSQYASGVLSTKEAMDLINITKANCNRTLHKVIEECLEILKPYAASNPQFALSKIQETIEYLQNNPASIKPMTCKTSTDEITPEQMEALAPLATLPSI